MEKKIEKFTVNGYEATVIIPSEPNGEWLWKTEFFYAFDKAENALCEKGFLRAYFGISDKYGSPEAVKLMYGFYLEIMKRYPFLNAKCGIIGFSRGGLYAFNYTLAHPETVKKAYFDAPVLDLRTWPRRGEEYGENGLYEQVLKEYGFKSEEEYLNYCGYPVENFDKYFSLKIPTLLIAGDSDGTVAFKKNSLKMIEYCNLNGVPLTYYVKVGVDHHPHSLGNDKDSVKELNVYSSEIKGSDENHTAVLANDEKYIVDFFIG